MAFSHLRVELNELIQNKIKHGTNHNYLPSMDMSEEPLFFAIHLLNIHISATITTCRQPAECLIDPDLTSQKSFWAIY